VTKPRPARPEAASDAETSRASEFERRAERAAERASRPAGEFLYFLRRTRKWWMAPIIAMLLMVGVLLVMSSSVVAPLIYTIF
jgi:hypothetical protein